MQAKIAEMVITVSAEDAQNLIDEIADLDLNMQEYANLLLLQNALIGGIQGENN